MIEHRETKHHLHQAVYVVEQFAQRWKEQRAFTEDEVAVLAMKYTAARAHLDKLIKEDFPS